IQELLGYTPLEWMNDPGLWIRHMHPDDRRQVLEQETSSATTGYFSSEYRMFTRTGKEIWVRDEGSIKDNSLYYGFLFDITKEKLSEQTAREIQQQIDLERGEIEQRLRALHKFEAVGRLAAGVAHDFNNLLMSITSYCELLKLELGEPAPSQLQEIQRAAEEGSVLTRHLLAFGGKQMRDPRKLDMNAVLKNLEPTLKQLVREDVQIELLLTENLGVIEADLSQMEDMIVNLTIVTRDSISEAGRIFIETSNIQIDRTIPMTHAIMEPGKYVQLSVTDTGPGLDQEAREHIFEPFYTRRDQTMGGGLRLPAVYGSVKQNHGYIWVYAEPGHGTTFRIYLPRIDAVAEIKPAPTELNDAVITGQTILVVDDNEAIRVAISAYLEMSGFKVLKASNGKEALQSVASEHEKNRKIDLLITDLVMPHMGGLELSQHLAMRNSKLKVLYMSGYTEESV
ncbi:MAG: response regulator, partial [Acidobacteriota bacterium]